jgi:Na+-translocating ferredoxin:NAD+ oxidoreductase subunit C
VKTWIRLPDFTGGILLETQKHLSSERPIQTSAIPPVLYYPLTLRSGHQAIPLVEAGSLVKSGTLIAKSPNPDEPPLYATSSGSVFFLEGPYPSPSNASGPMIGIRTDGKAEAEPPFPPLEGSALTPLNVIERIHASAIVGMGGAGFSTAKKLRALQGTLQLLIINGAECEPFLTCDERIIRERSDELLASAMLLAQAFQIPQVIFAVESSRLSSMATLQTLLQKQRPENATLTALPDRYPAGGERQLIRFISGMELPSGSHPVDHGILCLNVQTLLATGRAITLGERLTRRVVTVSGPGIVSPSNLEVLIGTPIGQLIKASGGLTPEPHQIILGGPMMGFSVSEEETPVTKTLSAVLALNPDQVHGAEPSKAYPCIRCTACVEACPAGLLPQALLDASQGNRLNTLRTLHLRDCIECACCDAVCPSHIPLTEQFRTAKKVLARQEWDERLAQKAKQRFEARTERLLREQQERDAEAIERKKALERGAQPKINEALERARLKREKRHLQGEQKDGES